LLFPPVLLFPPELLFPPVLLSPPVEFEPPEPLSPPEPLPPPDPVVSSAGVGRQLVVPSDSSPRQQTPAMAQAAPRNVRPKFSLSIMVPSLAARRLAADSSQFLAERATTPSGRRQEYRSSQPDPPSKLPVLARADKSLKWPCPRKIQGESSLTLPGVDDARLGVIARTSRRREPPSCQTADHFGAFARSCSILSRLAGLAMCSSKPASFAFARSSGRA